MDTDSFKLENYYELLVTHKMMMEARFCTNPIDLDVPVSPVAAGLHDRIIQKLIRLDTEKKGETAKQAWDEWLQISADYREWEVSLERAKNDPRWLYWNDMEQRFFTMTLLSPFEVSEELIAEFVGEVQIHQLRQKNEAA
ncbi:MAG: hypothetical protein AB8B84_17925 [Granulosicoccus sp.]